LLIEITVMVFIMNILERRN